MTDLTTLSEHACFGGTVSFHEHYSSACDAGMRFAAYVPPQAAGVPVPVLYYLAGLTTTEETFLTKGGALRLAYEHGLMLVTPDTSPRGLGPPGDDYDFGTGAGFYLDATAEPYSAPLVSSVPTSTTVAMPLLSLTSAAVHKIPPCQGEGTTASSLEGDCVRTLGTPRPSPKSFPRRRESTSSRRLRAPSYHW